MGKFEEHWREAFAGAEILPADSLWANIDLDLAYAEGVTMKKRVVLYQRVAAAAVMFALLIGSFGIYRWKADRGQLAQSKAAESTTPFLETEKNATTEANQEGKTAEQKEGSEREESPASNASSKSNTNAIFNKGKVRGGDQRATGKLGNDRAEKFAGQNADQPKETAQENSDQQEDGLFGTLATIGNPELLPVPEIHDGPALTEIMRKLPAISGAFLARKEKKASHEHAWASVTAAAGSYSPNTNSSANYGYAASSSAYASNSASVMGSSYSFGMLAGMRLTKKFVLQSGVQYSNQSVGSVSNINAAGSLNAVAQFAGSSLSSNYNTTTPYNITSANEFISVPVQAGYLFIDRKMGLQLNSGVSTDFFVRNTLSDPSGQRQSYSQGAGEDSPYRSVNFSGLLNSEVSYRLGNRYRVSVVPGIRYSFNPILKSVSSASGNALIWDVGFRFRYIFM